MGKMGKMAQMMANTDYNYAGGGGNEGVSVCVSVYLCVCVGLSGPILLPPFSFQFVLLSVAAKLTSILCCSCISILSWGDPPI